jgi:hypothetical protein
MPPMVAARGSPIGSLATIRSDRPQRSRPLRTEPITHEHLRALAVAVRDGELTPEQREHLGDLLHTISTAVTLTRRDHHPDNDSAALGYLIATWAPVSSAYAELAATVCRDGEEQAA